MVLLIDVLFMFREARQPLNDLIQIVFPTLQELMTQVLDNNTIEAAQVMRVCLKIFWSSTQYQLPDVQGVDVNLWFHILASLMDKKLPEASEGLEPAGQPLDVEERVSWPWWKVIICNTLTCLSSYRYDCCVLYS